MYRKHHRSEEFDDRITMDNISWQYLVISIERERGSRKKIVRGERPNMADANGLKIFNPDGQSETKGNTDIFEKPFSMDV